LVAPTSFRFLECGRVISIATKKAGANAFLMKPFTKTALRQPLQDVLGEIEPHPSVY
jgi:FixJ family two-component response regulator